MADDDAQSVFDRARAAAREFRRRRQRAAAERQRAERDAEAEGGDDSDESDGESVREFLGSFVDTDGDGQAEARVGLTPLASAEQRDEQNGQRDSALMPFGGGELSAADESVRDSALMPFGTGSDTRRTRSRPEREMDDADADAADFDPVVDAAAEAFEDGRVSININVSERRSDRRGSALTPLADSEENTALQPFPMEDNE